MHLCITGHTGTAHDPVDTRELSDFEVAHILSSNPSPSQAPPAGLLSALSTASRSLQHHMRSSSIDRRVTTANNSSASASSHVSQYEKAGRQSGRRSFIRGVPSLSGRKSLKDITQMIQSVQGARHSSGGAWGSGGGAGGGGHHPTTQRGTRFGAGAADR